MGEQRSHRTRVSIYQLGVCLVAAVSIAAVIVVIQDRQRHKVLPLLGPENPPSPQSFTPERLLEQ